MSTSSGSDDLDHEAGYWCVAAGERLGVYDGHERWSVFAGGLTDPDLQVTVSLHERLHHELQHTTQMSALARALGERISVDHTRSLPANDLEQHEPIGSTCTTGAAAGGRPCVPPFAERAADFARSHRVLGQHVLFRVAASGRAPRAVQRSGAARVDERCPTDGRDGRGLRHPLQRLGG